MIFVTLGTHEQPFTRAVDLLSELELSDEQIIVQHGTTPARPSMHNVEWVEYLDWTLLTENVARADAVITHAGVGSAVTAIRAGKKPVMVPRLARFGEHVDDHQLQLARRFEQRRLALACCPGDTISKLVSEARGSWPATVATRRDGLRGALAAAAAHGPGRRVGPLLG